jgi:prepilin-type N-terminal cleavage/methylation domain-containing protein
MKVCKNSAGFSLIELLVVMIIISLIAGIGIPRFIGSLERADVRASAGKIAAAVRASRNRSVSEKITLTVVIDGEKRVVYGVNGGGGLEALGRKPITPSEEIPQGITIWQKRRRVNTATIEFHPSGGSSGGSFVVTSADVSRPDGETGYVIDIDPLSGRVTMRSAHSTHTTRAKRPARPPRSAATKKELK